MEEVVRSMAAKDIRIAALNPVSRGKGAVPAFSISFSYSDRYKAQETVQALMNRFDELNLILAKRRAEASQSVALRFITRYKACEMMGVVETASLPPSPVKPNRPMITAAGLGIGLLLGAISLWLRRPRTPAPIALSWPMACRRDRSQSLRLV